jgi:Protein of unknown function (DUF3431)
MDPTNCIDLQMLCRVLANIGLSMPGPVMNSSATLHLGVTCNAGCCAEFVVSRQRIHARPKQFYVDLLARLDKLGPDDAETPFAVENCWHAIFVSFCGC